MKTLEKIFLSTGYRGVLQTDALDGIRGVAVLFVLFSHMANVGLVLLPIKFAGHGSGQIGVYLFFVLSSYLLTNALLTKLESNRLTRDAWLNYACRRITRIYPFYLVALIFTVIATQNNWQVFDSMQLSDVVSHLILLDGKMHFWTIATEVKFYLMLPVFIFVFTKFLGGNSLIFLAFILVSSLIATGVSLALDIDTRYSIVRCLPIFLMGTASAVLCRNQAFTKYLKLNPLLTKTILYLSFALLILLMPNTISLVAEFAFGCEVYNTIQPKFYILWGILSSVLIVSCIHIEGAFLKKVFESTLLRTIGAMSFSLYINHWFVLKWVSGLDINSATKIILFWSVSLLVSAITFLAIERPLSMFRLELVVNRLMQLIGLSSARSNSSP